MQACMLLSSPVHNSSSSTYVVNPANTHPGCEQEHFEPPVVLELVNDLLPLGRLRNAAVDAAAADLQPLEGLLQQVKHHDGLAEDQRVVALLDELAQERDDKRLQRS